MNKTDYLDYRTCAQLIYPLGGPSRVGVPHDATVWPCEDGAYVQAVVWVSQKMLDAYRASLVGSEAPTGHPVSRE